ncbi:hypothetical protein Tsubulata_049484 [Turnera subulata]|uniref:DUF4283 domain-containing protein n=1 Tax=Turnera subulata TaxID=218843 RepID=A0A9Q0F9Q5_9ROSI|nr:hypothetical protein Tsubulata_049484 [Turnera subulata]
MQLAHAKSTLVMDLGKLVLPKPNSALRSNGKNIPTAIPAPVALVPAITDSTEALVSLPNPDVLPPMKSMKSEATVASSPSSPTNQTAPGTTHMPSSHTSWAKVVSTGKASPPQPLTFVAPILADDNSTLCIPSELLDIGWKKYSLCLIGQFMGSAPKMGLIYAIVNKIWGREGAISVSTYKDGLFLFQFPNESAYNHALYGGYWHVSRIPLVLQPWTSSLQKLDFSTATFPVWVQMKNVPMELLTQEGLSYLASVLGTPLHADRDCSKLFQGDSANVCIKIDFSKPLKHEIVVDIHGEKVAIVVSYSWKPQQCDHYQGWGHHALVCERKKLITKWIQKAPKVPVATTAKPVVLAAIDPVLNVQNSTAAGLISSSFYFNFNSI